MKKEVLISTPNDIPPLETDTPIIDEIESHVMEIQKLLWKANCEEVVTVSVSNKIAVLHLRKSQDTYVSFGDKFTKLH